MKSQFKYFKLILLFAVVIALVLSIVIYKKNNIKTDIYTGVRNKAEELADIIVNKYGVSGLQYALISEGEILVSGTAGVFDKNKTIDLNKNTLFGIGSTSKMFTTAAILMLSDEGAVDLDEPILTYIPEFKTADERYKQITVRMLLNHSSGLLGSTFLDGFLFDYPSLLSHDNLLTNLETQKLKAAPGEFSVYCNDGFTLAEIIVERVSGMSFTDYIKKNITEPLKMSDTFTPQSDFNRNRHAKTFVYNEETPVDTINIIGTGGLYSTAEDLCKFGQIFMSNTKNNTAQNMLSEKAKTATKQKEYKRGFGPDQQDGVFGYGLGWDSVDAYPYSSYNIQVLIKGGDTQLYHSSLIVIPEHNITFAVVLSGGSGFFGQVLGQELIPELLLAEGDINKITPQDLITVPELSAMPAEKSAYSGVYASCEAVKNVVNNDEGIMTISSLSNTQIPDEKYLYTAEGWFVSEDGSKKLTFADETNGKTYIWVKWLLNLPELGQTSMSTYDYERVQTNNIDAETQNAWYRRNGTRYYIVNENPHAQHRIQPPVVGLVFV